MTTQPTPPATVRVLPSAAKGGKEAASQSSDRSAFAVQRLPDFNLNEFLRVLWRRRWLMGATLVLVFCSTLLVLTQLERRYTATAQVMVDPRQQNVVDLEQVLSGLPVNAETIQSEIEVLTSRSLAARVIGENKLDQLGEFNAGPGLLSSLLGAPKAPQQATRNRMIDLFLDRLEVRAAGRSRVIDISFQSADPELAAKLANSIADLYLVEQMEAKFDATRRASAFLDERLAQLQEDAEKAELAVARFRARMNQGVALSDPSAAEALANQEITAVSALERAKGRLQQLQDLQQGGAPDADTAWLGQQISKAQSEVAEAESALTRVQEQQKSQQIQQDDPNEAAVKLRTLERDAQASRALFETFLNRSKQTREQQGLERPDARLIARADVPVAPSFPDTRLALLLALVGGIGAALVLAFLAEQLDSGFRSSDQIEAQLGQPVISMMPELRSIGVKDVAPETYIMTKPNSSFSEAVRMLRTSLLLSNVDHPPRILLLTSALPGEGKTTVALTLAKLAAASGEKVIVIDADLRRPRVHGALGLENNKGLVELLAGHATFDQVLQNSEKDGKGFSFIPAGKSTPHATELIRSQQMRRFVRALANSYSLVIIDSPPVLPVADAKVLATLVDKVVYIVRWRDTRREIVAQAVKQLREVNADFAGIVLNQVDVRRHAEYSYSDSGYYYGRYRKYYND